VSSSSYSELSRAELPKSSKIKEIFATPPALYQGRIYCRNWSGDLVCIDVSNDS
jgi:hypothetical protein